MWWCRSGQSARLAGRMGVWCNSSGWKYVRSGRRYSWSWRPVRRSRPARHFAPHPGSSLRCLALRVLPLPPQVRPAWACRLAVRWPVARHRTVGCTPTGIAMPVTRSRDAMSALFVKERRARSSVSRCAAHVPEVMPLRTPNVEWDKGLRKVSYTLYLATTTHLFLIKDRAGLAWSDKAFWVR